MHIFTYLCDVIMFLQLVMNEEQLPYHSTVLTLNFDYEKKKQMISLTIHAR